VTEAVDGFLDTLDEGCGAYRVSASELIEASAQTLSIELIDRKDPNATLCTPGMADEPIPTAPANVAERQIKDLYEFLVAGREHTHTE
jgi:hypothetical protein